MNCEIWYAIKKSRDSIYKVKSEQISQVST